MGDKEITKIDEKQKKIKILKSNIENEDEKSNKCEYFYELCFWIMNIGNSK